MKKKVVVIIAAAIAIAVVLYFALPGLLVKWARDSEQESLGAPGKEPSRRRP